MRAVLCRQFGPPASLVLAEVPSPEPGPGEVTVAVKACGVNFVDALMIEGKYQERAAFPFSPGAEVAGLVARIGPGVEGVRLNDRVMAFCLTGGFAEEVVVRADRLSPLPGAMDFIRGAALLIAYGTAAHALVDRGRLRTGEKLLVLGAAGGAGTAAIAVGKMLGAEVIAAASTEEKLSYCRESGADHLINVTTHDLRKRLGELTDGYGVDVVFDAVGGALSETALRSTARNGRLLVVGFASGEIPRIALNLPLLRGCSIVGVLWAPCLRNGVEGRRSFLDLIADGKLQPRISRTFPLEQAADAILELKERRALGKIVVIP